MKELTLRLHFENEHYSLNEFVGLLEKIISSTATKQDFDRCYELSKQRDPLSKFVSVKYI